MNTGTWDVNTSHSEVSHDVAKEAAEHEEHLTHVLHQLQNKPWAAFMLLVCFPTLSMGFWLSMLFNRWQAGLVSSFV
jgi:hypothetical protein